MNLKPKLAVNLVAVLLIGLLMVGWVITRVVGSGLFEHPFVVTADFKSSGGVFTNQEVTYRGVFVGKVGELSLNDDGVNVELLIEPEWEGKIPAGVRAQIESKSAVGEQFVNLTPLSGTTPTVAGTLQDGDTIARADTKLPVDFQGLLRSLDRVLSDVPPGQAGDLVTALSKGLHGHGKDIAAILRSLGRVSRTFASVAPEQQRLLVNANRAGSAFLRTKNQFASAIRASDKVLAGIGDEPEELAAFFRANDDLARRGIALLARRGRDLAGGIDAFADFVDYQLDTRQQLENTLTYVPQFLHAIEDSSIPWRNPDGSVFYRIRTGIVIEPARSSWPCKYKLPDGYERQPHVRDGRKHNTNAKCLPPGSGDETLAAGSLVRALRAWADRNNPESVSSVLAGTSGGPVSDEGMIWPLGGAITSYYGPRGDDFHTGIDIDGETGDPVVAAAGGTVMLAGRMSGYGNAVVIDHGGGLATLYGHLSVTTVSAGDVLDQGEVVGLVGCTGSCTGSHLHFEVRVNGAPVDPLPYLPGGFVYTAPPPDATSPEPDPDSSPSPETSPRPSPSPSPSRSPGRIRGGE